MQILAVDAPTDLSTSTLVVGVIEGPDAVPGGEEDLASVPSALLEVVGFTGKKNQTLLTATEGAQALLLVGVGDSLDFESLRAAVGTAVRAARTPTLVTSLAAVGIDGATRAVVEGLALGGYRFEEYKKPDEDSPQVATAELLGADRAELDDALIGTEATNQARTWVNRPAMAEAPSTLADEFATVAASAGCTVEVWDETRIAEKRLGALLGVAAGSDRPPRVVTIEWAPEGAQSHIAVVGKGIVFDTGGLSIKPASAMEDMKTDMSGAAAAVAATVAAARLGLETRVTAIVPLTDNAISGNATRPGDVLRPLAGPTIEVLNTDAEGRLVLADGLGLAREAEPDYIVDVATLTGAAHVALGDKISAVFSNDEAFAARVLDAAARAGEDMWQLPLYREYRKAIDSEVADIKNTTGSRYGGAITAALFLAEYAGDGPWAHIDIAGPARWPETAGEQVKGGSGAAVRTLIELIRGLAE